MDKNRSYGWSLVSCQAAFELSNTSRIIALIKWHIIWTDWIRQGCSSVLPNILRLPSSASNYLFISCPFNSSFQLSCMTAPVYIFDFFPFLFTASNHTSSRVFASLWIIPRDDLCPMKNPSFSSIFLSKLRQLSETRVDFNCGPCEGQPSRSNSYGDKNKNRHISLYILNSFALH